MRLKGERRTFARNSASSSLATPSSVLIAAFASFSSFVNGPFLVTFLLGTALTAASFSNLMRFEGEVEAQRFGRTAGVGAGWRDRLRRVKLRGKSE